MVQEQLGMGDRAGGAGPTFGPVKSEGVLSRLAELYELNRSSQCSFLEISLKLVCRLGK